MVSENEHCAAVAHIIEDFRTGEIEPRTADHVRKFVDDLNGICDWMTPRDRLTFLSGLNSALTKHYWSKTRMIETLVGPAATVTYDPDALIFVQAEDSSQARLLTEVGVGDYLRNDDIESGRAGLLVYIDDATFTGKQLSSDLQYLADRWSRSGRPPHRLLVWHVLEYSDEVRERISVPVGRLEGLGVEVEFDSVYRGSRDPESGVLDVLLPDTSCSEIPRVVRFLKSKPNFLSMVGNKSMWRDPSVNFVDRVFDSPSERSVVERVFVEVGCYLRSVTKEWDARWRPLGFVDGYTTPSMGFGSMFCTYMNSSNNSPMALWWGDPTLGFSSGPSMWDPLLPRRFPRS